MFESESKICSFFQQFFKSIKLMDHFQKVCDIKKIAKNRLLTLNVPNFDLLYQISLKFYTIIKITMSISLVEFRIKFR